MTAIDYRRHCEDFTTQVAAWCEDRGVRRDLRDGRGRQVKECLRMHRYLTAPTTGHGHRRAHYTVATLIALVDPLEAVRGQLTPPAPSRQAPPPPPSPPAPEPAPAVAGTVQATPAPRPGSPDSAELPYTSAVWRKRPNLGTSLARAVHQAGFNEASTDNLLYTIVSVDDDHLHPHILPSLTGRLLRAGITPDWPVLLDDLSARAFDADHVATRWLDAFYLTLANPTSKD